MDDFAIRTALDRAIRARGESFASMARLLGRNPTYVQQFVRRGVPRRLEAADIRTLARHLGIAEAMLGENGGAAIVPSPEHAQSPHDYVLVPHLDRADRADGSFGFAFQAGWLRALASTCTDKLGLVDMTGDAMHPTLVAGDQLLVDTADAGERVRDGLYALRLDHAIVVKRLAVNLCDRQVTIISDNDAYPVQPPADPARLTIVGRVVWKGRRFA